MGDHEPYFDFPPIDKAINIHGSFDKAEWKKANSLKLGGNGKAKVIIKGQHFNDILYVHFEIDDNTLRKEEDSLTICIDSKKAVKPSPENILIGCEFTFDENGSILTYLECDNDDNIWKVFSPDSEYIKSEIKTDSSNSYWSGMIQINFVDLKEQYGINPDSFGLYIKVLDYDGRENNPAPYYWPITAYYDDSYPYRIPPHEQWAIGRFVNLTKIKKLFYRIAKLFHISLN